MDAIDVALILHIDGNEDNLNSRKNIARNMYESEALRCVESWRQNAGWLSNCNIYALCCTDTPPTENTRWWLKEMGVTYVESICPRLKEFSSGFLTIPYTGYFFTDIFRVPERIVVRIDLDNKILKPFPMEWFETAWSKWTVFCGQYSEVLEDRSAIKGDFPLDTSLIITRTDFPFYKHYYENCFSEKYLNSEEWKRIKAVSGDYWLEEFVVDMMWKEGWNINPVKDYQYGPGYGSLEKFIKEGKTANLYMEHAHVRRQIEQN